MKTTFKRIVQMRRCRFLVLIIALSSSVLAMGQKIQEKKKATSPNMPTLRAGVSFNTVNGSDATDTHVLPLYDVSLGYQWMINERKCRVFLSPELGFGTRGWKEGEQNEWSYHATVRAHTLRLVPAQISFQPQVGYDVYLDFHAGGFISYDYAGRYTNFKGYFQKDDCIKLSEMDNFNRWDAGIQVGAGLWFYYFNVDFTYRHGFVGMISGKDGFSNNFVLRVGYAFHRRPKTLPPGVKRSSLWYY